MLTGAEAFLAVRSYLSTARKQGLNRLDLPADCSTATPGSQPRPAAEQLFSWCLVQHRSAVLNP
jgi:hypothetical protein